MSNHSVSRKHPPTRRRWLRRRSGARPEGQALIEYALILAVVVVAVIAVLTITGPAVGNVFSNTVYNLLGGQLTPRETLAPDDFWTQVAAVASYTPENPGLVTNTPAPPTRTPTIGPSPTFTPVSPTPLPTYTFTPGPTPTPVDLEYGYPFIDNGNNPDWWQHDFDDLITGPWNAEYWNYAATASPPFTYNWRTDMSAMTPGSGIKRETVADLDYNLASGVAPSAGVNENYYARYTTTVRLEAKQYTFRIQRNNGIRIWVGGFLVVDANLPYAGDAATWSNGTGDTIGENWFDRRFTAGAGDQEVKVEFVDVSSTAKLHVYLIDTDGLLDTGDCHWALSDEQSYSPTQAWSDSPGALYDGGSYCVLALRGTIDMTTAVNPRMQFYDRWNLKSGTRAMVGISIAGSGVWTETQLHYQNTNFTWTRQNYDLTNFGGQSFAGRVIEVRFVLDAKSTSDPGTDGWWIDDIKLEEEPRRVYTVGFVDDMEGTAHWYPGGTWARSNESANSPSTAWSDSPGGDYSNGTDAILELDGVIDFSAPQVRDPELLFWHHYNLNSGDGIYAEVSTDRASWTRLTGAALAYQTTENGWKQVLISMDAYEGQVFYFRFRIITNGSNTADGWWIDDFELRNEPTSVIYPDWCDGMEGGAASWIAEGSWGVVSGSDTNPNQTYNATISAHGGGSFWSDSPGDNYLHNTNNSIKLSSLVDLTGTVDPQLVFWHQWDLAYSDNILVEISTDGGDTWTTAWYYNYGMSAPLGHSSVVRDTDYDHVLSWTREVVNLRAYVDQQINVRFRLNSTYDAAVDNGWFLDDICFQEQAEPIRIMPFSDNFEAGGGNWFAGGRWAVSGENKHAGSRAFSDSPGLQYNHQANAVLELRGLVDLSGSVEPTLYYWEAFNIGNDDYGLVEVNVSNDGGQTWNGWAELTAGRRRNTTTLSWDRRQIDLAPYIPNVTYPDRLIRLRFRLYASDNSNVADGWWIDDVSIVDRDGIEPVFVTSWTETVDGLNNWWVYDGTWARVQAFRMVGSADGLGPGGWTGVYYQDTDGDHAFDAGEYRFTRLNDVDTDENWGNGRPAMPSPKVYPADTDLTLSDNFMVRWTRQISLADDTRFVFRGCSDDYVRIIVDPPGDPATDPTYPNGWGWNVRYWYPDPGRGFSCSADVEVLIPEGLHTIMVEFKDIGSLAQVLADFGKYGYVFHDSPNSASPVPYMVWSDMSVTLEGMIDLAGTANPALTYWETRNLEGGDTIYVEVSTNEGFTWSNVRSTSGGVDATWRKRLVNLSSYAGQLVNIRFRLSSLDSDTNTDGWYIDDIVVAE